MIDETVKEVLTQIADLDDFPEGAYNIRVDGKSIGYSSTERVKIAMRPTGDGMDITVAPGTKGERIHIPVVIKNEGITETVYNDFFIGDDCDITIVAGCGIHNCGREKSQHDGVHTFHVGKNSRVSYIEKHYGDGDGTGERILNPVTNVYLQDGGYMEMDTVQIKGVNSTKRLTSADLMANSTLIIREKLMTHDNQTADTEFIVNLNGDNSSTNVVSRSVAAGTSIQRFFSKINGNAKCHGHSECDAIIMDSATVVAVPEITANCADATLIHEAAIGKIAGEQIIKLMTLGLSESEAEERIVNGFLK